MRIGIDIAKALGPRDGIARYTEQLVKALARQDGQHRYLLSSVAEAPQVAFEERFSALPEAFTYLEGDALSSVDLFHATAYGLPDEPPARLLATVHDLTFLSHPELHTLGNRHHCLAGLAAALAGGAHLVAVSEYTKRSLQECLAIDEDRIDVVYNGVEERFFCEDDQPWPDGVPAGARYFLSVGTAEPRKNLSRLIEAFASLKDETVSLVLVGGHGWLESSLNDLAREHGAADRIVLLGAVPDDQLVPLYCHALAFVYPSIAEGFGLPVAEAMASGAPVITSNTSALPEVVGNCGLLVDPTEVSQIRQAMADLCSDPDRRRELAHSGRQRAKRFSWDTAACAVLEIYRRFDPESQSS